MRTELDDWARLFNLSIMGGDFPGVEAIYRAGFEKAIKEVTAKLPEEYMIESIKKLGQGPARDGEQ